MPIQAIMALPLFVALIMLIAVWKQTPKEDETKGRKTDLWYPVLFLVLGLSLKAQNPAPPLTDTPPVDLPGSSCVYTVLQDGKLQIDCTRPQGQAETKERPYVICQTKLLNVLTMITIYPQDAELQLIDLDKLAAAMTPPAQLTSTSTITMDKYNLPTAWQSLVKFVVTRAEWEALPEEKRWGAVKGQPPTLYSKVAVSGKCMAEALKMLRLKAEEPY